MEFKKNNFELAGYYYILIAFFIYLITVVPSAYDPYVFPNALLLRFSALFLTVLYISAGLAEGRLTYRKNGMSGAPLFFTALLILTSGGATVFKTALWGANWRETGLFSWLSFIALSVLIPQFINSKERFLALIEVVMVSFTLLCLYGLSQYYGFDPIADYLSRNGGFSYVNTGRTGSILGNSLFFGSFIVLMIPSIIGYFMLKKRHSYLMVPLVGLGLVMLFLTESMSALGGMFIALLVYFFFYLQLPTRVSKKFILAAIAIVFLSFTILFLLFSFNAGFSTRIKAGEGDLYNRILIWRTSLKVASQNPLYGTGLDNFAYHFYKYAPSDWYHLTKNSDAADKAHNLYIELSTEAGFISLLAFVWIFVLFFFRFVDRIGTVELKERIFYAGIFSGISGYLAALQFGMSELLTTPYLWIFTGGILGLLVRENTELKLPSLKKEALTAVYCVTGFLILLIVFSSLNKLGAEIYIRSSIAAKKKGNLATAIQLSQKALDIDPDNEFYHRIHGENQVFNALNTDNFHQFNEAIGEFLIARELNPYERITPFIIGESYYLASKKYGTKYLRDSFVWYGKTLEMDEYYLDANLRLAEIYISQGDKEAAEKFIRAAFEVDPENVFAENAEEKIK